MKPGLCEIHGSAPMTMTSPKIIETINLGLIYSSELIVITIESDIGNSFYVVDEIFARAIFNNQPFRTLIDRNKKEKKLNDRLLIRKLICSMSWVCAKCLRTATGYAS